MSWANWREVVTRKPHTCMGCYGQIQAGERAHKGVGNWDGDFFHGYLCVACADFLDRNIDYFQDGFCEGEIGEARREEEEKCQT